MNKEESVFNDKQLFQKGRNIVSSESSLSATGEGRYAGHTLLGAGGACWEQGMVTTVTVRDAKITF
jgi:hypothetical protein